MNIEIIKRLSQYKSVLQKLKTLGFVKVFSDNLGDAIGVSSSLVRRDFTAFGLTGNKRGGYNIDELITRLNTILGKEDVQRIIIVGCGKIGTALMNYTGFSRENIEVVAGFDSDPAMQHSDGGVPVYAMDRLSSFVKEAQVAVAITTVPDNAVNYVLEQLTDAGIKGILNFAPVSIKCDQSRCVVHNINIALEIEKMFSLVHFQGKEHGKSERV